MRYVERLHELGDDAEHLEEVYHNALNDNDAVAFEAAVEASFAKQPANLLYAAWHYRLAYAARAVTARRSVAWALAICLALANGLVFWLLSDTKRFRLQVGSESYLFTLIVVWAPIAAIFVLGFLSQAGRRAWRLAAILAAGLVVLALYPLLTYPLLNATVFQEQYIGLALIHVPVLAWAAVGIYLLWHKPDPDNRFAFLFKSLEVFVLAGLFAGALGLVTVITMALFQALGITMAEWVQWIFVAGGWGMIPVLAVAIVYDPKVDPVAQPFDEGLSKLIVLIMRLLLPLTLLISVIYVVFIPFNFWKPFENRYVLIIYNGMLFAVMALLVGATPLSLAGLSVVQQRWLRRGLVALASVAALVSVYALTAIVYRTVQEGFTPNRVTFIGWNVINTGLLVLLLVRQLGSSGDTWVAAMKRTYSVGTVAYVVWSLVVLAALPWLF